MTDPETVRMTYAELARARGVTIGAAKRLSVRHRWPKQVGNDGLARIEVPASFAGDVSRDVPHNVPGDVSRDVPGDFARVLGTLEAAVSALREQLAVANQRADRAEDRARELQEQLAAAQERVTGLLTDQRLTAPAPARRSWWPWRRG